MVGIDAYRERCANKGYGTILRCALGLAGKVMGYAGLGRIRAEWVAYARRFMRASDGLIRITTPQLLEEPWLARDSHDEMWKRSVERRDVWDHLAVVAGDETNQTARDRDWAATAQWGFQLEVRDLLEPYLLINDYDGLVLSGGCALNVIANSCLPEWKPIDNTTSTSVGRQPVYFLC